MIWMVLGLCVLQVVRTANATSTPTPPACANSSCTPGTSVCRVDSAGHPFCSCYFGYRGTNCTTDVDECRMGHPCKATGLCINTFGSYRCTCLSGWQGPHCETRDLSKPPKCLAGWRGSNCTDDVDECTELADDPCSPNGKCINKPGTYHCDCHAGWKGQNCSMDVDECLQNPCRNGGRCSNTIGSYTCACASPWFGINCNTTQCSQNRCQNGGNCVTMNTASYLCQCSAPWVGQNCERNSTCSYNPCRNGGTCLNATGSYECTCALPWHGDNCKDNSTRATPNEATDAADVPLIVGLSVGAVLLVSGLAAGAALLWWVMRGKKVSPDTRVTIVEVLQTTTPGGETERPGTTTELSVDNSVEGVGKGSLGLQPIKDIVMKTRFSLRQCVK